MVDDGLVMVGVAVRVGVDARADVGAAYRRSADDWVADTTVDNVAVAAALDNATMAAAADNATVAAAVDNATMSDAAVAAAKAATAKTGAYGDACHCRLCCESEGCGDYDG